MPVNSTFDGNREPALSASQVQTYRLMDSGSKGLAAVLLPYLPAQHIRQALAYTAIAESSLNATASGDNGRSIGVLQFLDTTAERLAPEVPYRMDWRKIPRACGFAAVVYIAQAVRDNPEWKDLLTVEDPLSRLAAFRVLWRYNPYKGQSRRAARIAEERSGIRESWLRYSQGLVSGSTNRDADGRS
jgi:hypothetical protein